MRILLLSIAMFCFSYSYGQNEKALAKVQKTDGIYVFTDSEPVNDYEVLDRVKSSIGLSSSYTSVKNKLIRKALKEYPDADGVILTMVTGGTDKATIIKFKKNPDLPKDEYAKAMVNKTDGILVFVDSEPVNEYSIVERVSVAISLTGQYSEIKNRVVTKARKASDEAEGVIINFTSNLSDKATVVKFN